MQSRILTNISWRGMEVITVSLGQIVLMIIFARLLSPNAFGSIAIIMAIIGLASVLANFGLPHALIQTPTEDDSDLLSTTLTVFLLSCVIYLCIFLIANKLAVTYEDPEIEGLLKFGAISIIPMSIGALQRAKLQRKSSFRTIAKISIISNVCSGAISIYWATKTGSVYALMSNILIVNLVSCGCLLWQTKGHLTFKTSKERIITLTSYSYKILLGNFLDASALHLYPLILGTYVSKEQLGFYHNGRQIPNVIASVITGTVNSVLFPELSKLQTNTAKIRELAKQSIVLTSFVMICVVGGFSLNARYLIESILGAKWLGSVIYLQLFSVYFAINHLQNMCLQVISARGRSDIFSKYIILNRCISLLILVLTAGLSLVAVIIGQIVSVIIAFVVNTSPSNRIFEYGITEQVRDIFPLYLSGGISFYIVYILLSGKYDGFAGFMIIIIFFVFLNLLVSTLLSKNLQKIFLKLYILISQGKRGRKDV